MSQSRTEVELGHEGVETMLISDMLIKYANKSPQTRDLEASNIQTRSNADDPDTASQPFRFSDLLSEIRTEVFAHYFASLPHQQITCTAIRKYNSQFKLDSNIEDEIDNLSLAPKLIRLKSTSPPYHNLTPLTLLSPSPAFSFPPHIYYRNTTFTFTCPSALLSFISDPLSHRHVRSVRINYGRVARCGQGPDWVFMLLEGFERLTDIAFVVEGGCGCCGLSWDEGKEMEDENLKKWWRCIEDAVREGGYTVGVDKGNGKDGKKEVPPGGEKRRLRLRLEIRRGGDCVLLKES